MILLVGISARRLALSFSLEHLERHIDGHIAIKNVC